MEIIKNNWVFIHKCEKTYKCSVHQKMKRTAMDNNYMIQVLSSCFIDNTLNSSESLCQA